ncbi:hypothetical protein O181_021163 [Austropuccinia psidii MF-1]|uniref:Integrase catalytic domain-containing protein n=1 Tax=Austropuccinia psidii MF-1 TaxID=1389203 RepID=A0A9Q3GV66_9BASI|nr:hypothetical protein [Austropuccinia psidii MF-1]
MGPITPESLGGAKYILVVVDSYSRFSWVQILRSKSDAPAELKKIIKQAKNTLERQVKKLICDGGKEFVNSLIKNFCDARGIKLTVTTPYTPQHNGIVERINRNLMDKARTLILETGVPKNLWGEVINTVNFLRVRVSREGKSPYEKLFNKKPNLGRIRRFGWYEPDFRVYRILLEETNKVIRSRDVRFYQDNLPLKENDNFIINQLDEVIDKEIEPIHSCDTPREEERPPIILRLRVPQQTPINQNENSQTSEGTNKNQKGPKPRWEWEIHTKAPRNISSTISTDNIIERQNRNNRVLVAEVGDIGLLQKEEAFYKPDILCQAMNVNADIKEDNPDSLKEARGRHDWLKWKQAYFSELDSIAEQNRYKARCVARGFKQKSGVDYQETFSPTGRLSTLRYLINYAVQTNQQIRQADFVTAYLNSELREEESVFSSPPEGFFEWIRETKPEVYEEDITKKFMGNPSEFALKLKKSLYGLKQAARSWYQTLKNWLVIDDILVVGEESEQVINGLKGSFKIKDLGLAGQVLGIKIIRNRLDHIAINQTYYINNLLEKYEMSDCKTTSTPMQSNLKIEPSTDEASDEFKKLNLDYRAAIGSLNYLAQCTRPDIAYVIGHLSQFLEKPNMQHWNCFKRVLRYLKGTKDLSINYYKEVGNEIVGYSDSSWAEDLKRRSWSGYIFLINGGIISWKSKKLGGVSVSSTEAEFRAYLSAFQEGKWLALLRSEIEKEDIKLVKIFSDNQGAISRAKNPIYHCRTKHIEVHYNSIRDAIENKEILLDFLPTDELIADCLTKALDRNKQNHFNKEMNLKELQPREALVAIKIENVELTGLRGHVEKAITEVQHLERRIAIREIQKSEIQLIAGKKRKALTLTSEKLKKRKTHRLINRKAVINLTRIKARRRALGYISSC